MNKTKQAKENVERYYTFEEVRVRFWAGVFVGILISITFLLVISQINIKYDSFCDYDSCSQEIYRWNYNGSSCFDSNNSECKEFLMLWNACQDYKSELGVC